MSCFVCWARLKGRSWFSLQRKAPNSAFIHFKLQEKTQSGTAGPEICSSITETKFHKSDNRMSRKGPATTQPKDSHCSPALMFGELQWQQEILRQHHLLSLFSLLWGCSIHNSMLEKRASGLKLTIITSSITATTHAALGHMSRLWYVADRSTRRD